MQQPQPTLPFAPAIGFARSRETAPAYWMLDLLWLVLVDGHENPPRGVFNKPSCGRS